MVSDLALAGRRVLVAHPSADLYGADRRVLEVAEALHAAGASVEVVIPEKGPLTAELDARGDKWSIEPFSVLRKGTLKPRAFLQFISDSPRAVHRFRSVIRERDPDFVYVNTITLPHCLAAAKAADVPALCHVRELESQLSRAGASLLLAPLLMAQTLIANSEATKRFITASLPSLNARTRVVYNGFVFDSHRPAARDSGRPRVVLVGRLSPRKGQDLAIEALPRLIRRHKDLELVLVGSVFRGYEWFEDNLRRQAFDLGLGNHVRFAGFQHDVSPFYRGASAVLVPSRLEPFGNVAVEALAEGVPVVASNVGGLPEIVDDMETGYLVRPGDPEHIADALERLLESPEEAEQMGARGAERMRSRFSVERFRCDLPRAVATLDGSRRGVRSTRRRIGRFRSTEKADS